MSCSSDGLDDSPELLEIHLESVYGIPRGVRELTVWCNDSASAKRRIQLNARAGQAVIGESDRVFLNTCRNGSDCRISILLKSRSKPVLFVVPCREGEFKAVGQGGLEVQVYCCPADALRIEATSEVSDIAHDAHDKMNQILEENSNLHDSNGVVDAMQLNIHLREHLQHELRTSRNALSHVAQLQHDKSKSLERANDLADQLEESRLELRNAKAERDAEAVRNDRLSAEVSRYKKMLVSQEEEERRASEVGKEADRLVVALSEVQDARQRCALAEQEAQRHLEELLVAQTSTAAAVDKAAQLQAQIISMDDSAAATAEALGKALADVDAARADAAGATHSRNIALNELSECQALLNEARGEHNRLQAALRDMEDQVGSWRGKHAAACSAERTRASEVEEARQRTAGLVSSVEQLQQEITLLKEQKSESQERLKSLSSNEGTLCRELTECQGLLDEARREQERLRTESKELLSRLNEWRDKFETVAAAERIRECEAQEERDKFSRQASLILHLQQEVSFLKEQESESQERLKCLSSNEGALRRELTECQGLLDEARREQERLRAESHDLAGELTDWRSKCATVKMEEGALESELDEARQRAAGLASSVEQLQQEVSFLKEQESESQERLKCLSSNEGALRRELTECQGLLDEARREQERLRAESHDLAVELTDWRSKCATVKMEEGVRGVMFDEGGFWASDGSDKCGVAMSVNGAVHCDTVGNSELQPSEKSMEAEALAGKKFGTMALGQVIGVDHLAYIQGLEESIEELKMKAASVEDETGRLTALSQRVRALQIERGQLVRQLADSKGRVQRGSPSNRAHEARAERAVEIAESTLRRVKSECRAFEERCIMLETEKAAANSRAAAAEAATRVFKDEVCSEEEDCDALRAQLISCKLSFAESEGSLTPSQDANLLLSRKLAELDAKYAAVSERASGWFD